MNKTRIIETNFYGAKAYEILDSVHGQLSDGMWENARGYDKYWTNFEVKRHENNRIYFLVNADYNTIYCGEYVENPFLKMNDQEFCSWYAGKLKAVITAEGRDNKWVKGWWKRTNVETKSIYLGHDNEKYGEIVSVADIYCVYDWLLNRTMRSPNEVMYEVFGFAADQKTIEKMLDINRAKQKYQAELQALEEKYNEEKQALWKAYNATLKEIELTNL